MMMILEIIVALTIYYPRSVCGDNTDQKLNQSP